MTGCFSFAAGTHLAPPSKASLLIIDRVGLSRLLRGAWPSAPGSSPQPLSDDHEVVGEDRNADKHVEPFAPFLRTSPHTAAAQQDRDAPFDSGSEPLSLAEGSTLLMGLALGCFLPSALGKALVDDTLGPAQVDVRGTVEAAISGVQLRSRAEDPLVVRQRGPYMSLVRGIAIQDVVFGDQTDRAFRQEDLVAELDRPLSLAPFDAIRVGLEDREDLVFVGNLLAFEHSAAGLIDNAIGEAAVEF